MSDLEAQKDELVALQSIYTNEEFKVNADGEEPGGQFFATLELPPNFRVVAKRLKSFSKRDTEHNEPSDSTKYAESLNIDHLPPIVLYVTLPFNYPSEAKPNYLISCKWLSRGKLSKICRHLDKLWEEYRGMEILFLWTQFLKDEVLQFLNVANILDVSPIYTKQILYLEKKRAHQQKSRLFKLQDSEYMKKESLTGIQSTVDDKRQGEVASNEQLTNLQTPISVLTLERPFSSCAMNSSESSSGQDKHFQGRDFTKQRKSQSTRLTKYNRSTFQKVNIPTDNKYDKHFTQHETHTMKQEEARNKLKEFSLNPDAPSFVFQKDKPLFDSSKSSDYSRTYCRHNGKHSKSVRSNGPFNFYIDSRTVFDLPITEPICDALQKFNQQQVEVVFARTPQQCTVCFTSKMGTDCIKFDTCGHIFCIACIRGYFEVQVRDGNVQSLKCLEDKCNTQATPFQVKSVLSAEIFAKYDAALLSATLDTLSDIVYCPRRACQYPVSIETEESMGRCPNCQFVFCVYCKMTYHGVEPCKLKSEEQQKLVNDYNTGSEETKGLLERRYGKKQMQRLVDTVLSEQWVSANSQNCPNCHVSIEKETGCNKMICWKCNCFFCWLCLTRLNSQLPYRHFNTPDSSCYNKLFEGANLGDNDDDDDEFNDIWLDGDMFDD